MGGAVGGLGKLASNTFKDVTEPIIGAGKRASNAVKTVNPTIANIQSPVTQQQIDQSMTGVGGSLDAQNSLLSALSKQGGMAAQTRGLGATNTLSNQLAANNGAANQQQTYNQQQNLLAALQGANGPAAQAAALAQQQGLNANLGTLNGAQTQAQALAGLQNIAGQQNQTGQMYQDIAQGRGPNPAQAALNQATGQNVANQAALMAGQRGAGANVGLLARQAAQQGAGIQQQAVGQGATMQAQQQLNALSGLTAQQQAQAATQGQIGAMGQNIVGQQQGAIGQLAGQGAGLTGQQQAALTQQAGQAQNQIQNQLGANQAYNTQANTLAGQQINQTNANTAAQQAQQNTILGTQTGYNQAQVSNQGNVNAANAATNAAKVNMQGQAVGGGLGALGTLGAAAIAAAHDGGFIENPHKMAVGGVAQSDPMAIQQQVMQAAQPLQSPSMPQSSYAQFLLNRSNPGSSVQFSFGGEAHDLKAGGDVAAKNSQEKAKVSGNSLKNDSVPALLSEGEIVIPRSITMGKDPVRGAAEFVQKEIAKRGK